MKNIEIKEYPLLRSGKVREVYDLGDSLLFIATDRISAFDCILPTPIPDKGKVLTDLSLFWFELLKNIVDNHLITADISKYPEQLKKYADQIDGRTMIVKKAEVLPVECIVRGYLAGSGWKEYQKNGTVTGIKLPDGLLESSELPEPIFTPSTKAESGHDENIPFKKMVEIIGEELATKVRDVSMALYSSARDHAKNRGIILADTKFEFGIADSKLILIDEVLTPDSSRFWPLDVYEPGKSQPSFDKQFVRDYLSSLDWDKEPPAPELPEDIVEKTREKYFQALDLLSK